MSWRVAGRGTPPFPVSGAREGRRVWRDESCSWKIQSASFDDAETGSRTGRIFLRCSEIVARAMPKARSFGAVAGRFRRVRPFLIAIAWV
jgi:hypothetical protein